MKAYRLLLPAAAALLAAAGLALLFLSARASRYHIPSAQTHPIQVRAPLAAIPAADINSWQVTCADCPPQFTESTDRWLRLDSQDRPHLAYGRDHLYYAWFDGSAWQSEVVDGSYLVGSFASLALDTAGMPHISYFDEHGGKLKYAFNDEAGWHIQSLTGADAAATSLALDSSGYAHIAYSYASRLHHAFQDAAGWHFEQVDPALQTGQRSSLALDSSGSPHVTYQDQVNGDLKYARRSAGTWVVQTIDSQDSAGEYSSIAMDAGSRPHISYSYYKAGLPPNRDLRYAYWDGSQWITTTVDTAEAAGQYTSIAVDDAGVPHISYYDGANLRYARKDGSTWSTATLDSDGNVGAYSSLAIDSHGWVHVGYYQSIDYDFGQNIRYIRQDASGWHSQLVDSGGNAGEYSSLDLDAHGFAHISYQDATYENLKYAYRDINGWHLQTLDWEGDVGRCTTLKLDVGEQPHIGYHDFNNKKLKYTYRDAAGWHTSVVDAGAIAGCQTSLALDSNGYPHFSYFDTLSEDLKYARWDGSVWHYSIVDRAGDGASDSSLALDAQDVPHISYLYAPTADLRYAYLDGSQWITTTVDSAGSVGWQSSLALDANGQPAIAYLDDSGDDLKYASLDGATWSVGVVDSSGDTGRNPSLAIGADGHPRISYTGDLCPTGSCGRLKYAELAASGWTTHTIPSPGEGYGFFSSLRLTPDDQPHISFFDHSVGDLKYAFIPTGLASVAVSAPLSVTIGSPYTFTASISPLYATQPVTFTWQAQDQPPVVHISGGSDSAVFTWNSSGAKLIQISADNGFSQVSSTLSITVTDIPIAGLAASNDSPTRLGQPTTLTASLQAGTQVSFTWGFGDGESGSGQQVAHTYPAAGIYTATLTASNSAGAAQATTQVLVGWWVYLPIVPDGE